MARRTKAATLPEFEPRRADEPGQVYTYNDADGEITLRADNEGVIFPKSDAHVRAADAFGLPVARKVISEIKAEVEADAPKAEAPKTDTADAGKEND